MLDSGSTPPPDRRPSQHSKRRRFRGFTVTSQRPELDQAVVISKALDLRPEFYAEHMPPCKRPEPVHKQWEEMPAGVAALV